jgi:hypothetical protein
MTEKHPLFSRAHRYTGKRECAAPDGFIYDLVRGGWLDDSGNYLVRSADANMPPPMTKKEDRETGEDRKGE